MLDQTWGYSSVCMQISMRRVLTWEIYIAGLWKSCFVSRTKFYLLRTKQHWANFARCQSLQQRHFTKLAQFSMLCYVCLHSKLFRRQKRNWLISSRHIIIFFQFIKTGWSVSHSVLWTTANVYSPCFKFPICVLDYEQFPFTA